MQEDVFDIAIIGGGIVGVAAAYKIQQEFPRLNLIILEKENELAFHQTGRNSGVIHSGLYYKPGSLRAKNCVRGRKKLIAFAKANNIEHDICGKIVLATNKQEIERLRSLKVNGEQNGLIGLKLLSPAEIKEIEPYTEGVAALWVPESGIINYKTVCNKLAERIVDINPNSKIACNTKLLDFDTNSLFSTKGVFNVKHSIFCAGLFSDRLAKQDKLNLDMQIVGFRGDYYHLSESAKNKVNHLIYPVPNPEFPFLGVHLTRMIDGTIECGPNAVFTFKREGYYKTDFSWKDTLEALSFAGTWKLFINHWKFGFNEYRRAFSKALFLKALKKMIPTLEMHDIIESRSGVRAMALGNNGEVIDDFKIVRSKNNLHVLNAPSPAATSCLAIGDQILQEVKRHFKLKVQ